MTDSMQMDTTLSDDAAALLQATVQEMSQALSNQDTNALKASLKKIKEESQSQAVVDFLVPHLFEPDATSTIPSSEAALSLVGCLVSTDASTYLKPISRAVRNEAKLRASSGKPMVVSPPLLSVIVSQLNGTDVEVSTNATDALVDCCRKLGPPLAQQVLQLITTTWKEAWDDMPNDRNTASTVCVRCATAVVDLAALNDNIMELTKSCGSMTLLLEMINYDRDPLLQMSVLDLVERLATLQPMHHQRAQWLGSDPVLTPLLQMAGANENEDPDPINGGAALRVLSAICRLGQKDSNLFAQDALLGFHKALHNFQGSGELDRLALIDAISSFASASPEALELVLQDPVTRDGWLSLSVAQPKLKAVVLNSVAMVIDPAPERDSNGDTIIPTATVSNNNNKPSTSLALKLFARVGAPKDSTEIVLGLAKSPLPETRLGAYNLLRAVAQTETGSQMLLSHTGFYDWLVSREGEPTKEGREGKFAVVQAVLESPVKGLLAEDIVKKLERIGQEGPHFVPTLRPELMAE